MHLIERVGSYVGLASFLGLAILALLYFSQARDLRRLREWAGRAPERAADMERAATTQSQQTAGQPAAETVTHVPPALPASQHQMPPVPLTAATAKRRKPLRDRIRNVHIPQLRYLALSLAGVLVLAGAAYGAVELINNDNGGTTSDAQKNSASGHRDRGADGGNRAQQVSVDPAKVTVAILNGTTVQGLAAKIGEEVRAGGFTLGTIGNAARIDQSRSEVLYRRGQGAAARAVANRLGIQSIGQVDSVNAEIAGSFDAIVLVGADRAG
jgi:LytR cell envelope-related transcriptional attenuator